MFHLTWKYILKKCKILLIPCAHIYKSIATPLQIQKYQKNILRNIQNYKENLIKNRNEKLKDPPSSHLECKIKNKNRKKKAENWSGTFVQWTNRGNLRHLASLSLHDEELPLDEGEEEERRKGGEVGDLKKLKKERTSMKSVLSFPTFRETGPN